MRYTAEFRGGDHGDKSWEWCVVDEYVGWTGSAFLFDLTEEEARHIAKELNERLEKE